MLRCKQITNGGVGMDHQVHCKQVMGKSLEYEGAPLRMEPKLEYMARKVAERKDKATPSSPAPQVTAVRLVILPHGGASSSLRALTGEAQKKLAKK